jgi:hypothetical protein
MSSPQCGDHDLDDADGSAKVGIEAPRRVVIGDWRDHQLIDGICAIAVADAAPTRCRQHCYVA